MGIRVIWDNEEQTIKRYVYEGVWTWQELFEALQTGHEMLDTVAHPVDAVVDMRYTNYMPGNAIANLRQVFSIGGSHRNYSGVTVFLNAGEFIRAVHSMVRELYPDAAARIDFRFARTLDEAHAIIDEQRRARPTGAATL